MYALLGLWIGFYIFVKFGVSWFFEHEHDIGIKKYALTSDILVSSLTILMLAKTINTLTRVFIWDYIVARILKGLVPILLIQCVALSIYIAACLLIIGMVFGKSVVGVLTTLGGIGVIIGLGTQRLVLDAFSGISINVDRSFTLGDFIKVSTQDYTLEGKVIKISWRLTTILTPENNLVTIPNSVISGIPVINFSKPEPTSEFQETYYFIGHTNYQFVEKILNNAVLAVAENGFIEKVPTPQVRLAEVMPNNNIAVSIIYFMDPLKNDKNAIKHFLHTTVLKHVHASGLHLAGFSKEEEKITLKEKLLDGISLLQCLNKEERHFLLNNMIEHTFTSNTAIVSQGTEGNSMFIIKQGFVTIHVKRKNTNTKNNDSMIGVLNPGDFFGEMSLLTGQKRNATIISGCEVIAYEIQKDVLQQLLQQNNKLYAEFANVSAAREMATKEHLRNLRDHEALHRNLFEEYLFNIKKFFNLR